MQTIRYLVCVFIGILIGYFVNEIHVEKSPTLNESTQAHVSSSLKIEKTKRKENTQSTPVVDEVEANENQTQIISMLKQRVEYLENKLNYSTSEDSMLKEIAEPRSEEEQAKTALARMKAEARKVGYLSPEIAEQHYDKPFLSLVSGASGTFGRDLTNMLNEPKDHDWALQIETNIRDFVQMHEFGQYIRLERVNCKKTVCEILAFEDKDKTFDHILNDMRLQAWWTFKGTHSKSMGGANQSYYYVLIQL